MVRKRQIMGLITTAQSTSFDATIILNNETYFYPDPRRRDKLKQY